MVPTRRGLDCPKYEQLVQKKKTKSPVWEHFRLPADEKGQLVTSDIAICTVCNSHVSSKGGSTTNLAGHLKVNHPMFFFQTSLGNKYMQVALTSNNEEECDVPEPDISQTENSCRNLKHGRIGEMPPTKKQKTILDFQPLDGNSAKQCTESVARFIVGSLQPYNIVESQPFINMVKTLNPRYKIRGRIFFSETSIPKLYNETIERIKKEISLTQVKDIFAITTDCWTSVANVPYIAITAHFIDVQWNLKSFCLSCTVFQDDHTSENIAETLADILSDWSLDVAELSCCTTDNGANIVKAISLLNVPRMPCFGYTINIGVNKALKIPVLSKAVARLRKLQSSIAHSWKIARDFKEAQEFL
ncbi:Zinc finger BED domain-containing protein 1 [Araneus ventricosus]|uniref:Zinc finger BED domain-containing protein 1 n=1 Tax=Araneus ventricosus TaxID=182803 RepID=A0A4Y2K0C6_ARAVE|nr:Zinc finger BED domain-containing protein 1 [Araneus ventricosus]